MGKAEKPKQKGRPEWANTDIHARWTRPYKRAEWFSLNDVFYRCSLTTVAIIWCQMTQPIKLINYTFGYAQLHYTLLEGTFLLVFFPVLPLAFLTIKIFEALKTLLTSSVGTEW